MATGTVRSVDYLVNTSFATNTSGLIGADDAQDSAETLGALPISPNENAATGITSTPYVLQITDRGTIVEMNNSGANQVSVPTNASVAFPVGTVIAVYQMGAGTTTVAAVTPGTTTIRNPSSNTTRAQFAQVYLRKRATDEWVLSGDLT